jgi:hypothetical protein
MAPLTQPFEEGALVQAAIFRFEPGSGEVSGENGVDEPIGAGEAVFLHEGEDHEMKSEAGLMALIIEGESLDRFRERPASSEALS